MLYHTAVKVLIIACTAIFEYLVTLALIFMVTLKAGDFSILKRIFFLAKLISADQSMEKLIEHIFKLIKLIAICVFS